jgi:hypothetical protein
VAALRLSGHIGAEQLPGMLGGSGAGVLLVHREAQCWH